MLQVQLPVVRVFADQFGTFANHQQVFGVMLFRGYRKIKRAGDDLFVVDNHDLAMGAMPGAA